MGTLLAFPLAMPLGGVAVTDLIVTPIGGDLWLVRWTPNPVNFDAAYMIAVDGKLFDVKTEQTSLIVRMEPNATPIVQVAQISAVWGDPGFFVPGFFDAIQPNKIRFTFNPPASVVDVVKYNVYWDNGTGTVTFDAAGLLATVIEDGSSSYEIFTDQISSGTFKFVVRVVDAAGNETTNVNETSQVISTYPGIVTGVVATFNAVGPTVTLTWVDPSDIGSGTVKIFDNGGSTVNLFPDYSAPITSVAAGVQTFTTGVLADGVHVFGFRVNNGTLEELNTSVVVSVRIETAAQVSGFPPKPVIFAETAAGGKIDLAASVDRIPSGINATKVKFFTNDGAGGAIDFGTPLGAGFIPLSVSGQLLQAALTTVVFGETARKFATIAFTDAGVPSVNSDEIIITPDATLPPVALSEASLAVRD